MLKNERTIRTLSELIAANRDCELGFRRCAERARNDELRQILLDRSREFADAAAQLGSLVRQLAGTAEPQGGASVPRRGWCAALAPRSDDDDAAVLADCERGEGFALEAYRNALDEHLPDFVRRVVMRQFEAAMSGYDHVRALRNQHQRRASGTSLGARRDAGR